MNIAVLCSNSADTHIWGGVNAHTACSSQHYFFFLAVFVVLDSPLHYESQQDEQETHQAKVRSHKKLFTTLQNPGKQFLMALFKI